MSTTTEITVRRRIPAPANDVYDAWLDPKTPGTCFSEAERLILNPVVDGLYYFVMEHQGRLWPHYGRFVRLERGRLVEQTWVSEATEGIETVVTTTFEPHGDETEMILRHTGVPESEVAAHEKGWTSILAAVAEKFAPVPANAGGRN